MDITFNIGRAGATSVDDKDYQAPFDFTGTIDKIVIKRDPPELTPADIKKLEAGNAAASD